MAGQEEAKDAARKRAIEASKKRAVAAQSGAVKATPSGVSQKDAARTSAVNQAKQFLKEGGSLQGTAIEEEPGFLNKAYHGVGRFLMDAVGAVPQAGDLDNKLGAATQPIATSSPLAAVLAGGTSALGILDTIQNRDERTGTVTKLNTAANAALDVTSIGTANAIRGTLDYVDENSGYQRGDDPNDAMSKAWQEAISQGEAPKTLGEFIDDRALEQEEIRAANPKTALGADIAASIFTGGGFAKGAYSLLGGGKLAANIGRNWYGRILFGSAVGATESFAYRMNKDGDLERAAKDAATTMLGGTILGGVFDGVKGITNIVRNTKSKDIIEEAVGSEVLRMVNIERQMQGLPAAKASDVAAEIAKLGPDATLMDAYPSLKTMAQFVLKNEDSAMAGDGLRAVIASRNDLMEELTSPDGTLRTAFGSKAVRGKTEFFDAVAARQKRISPRYKEIETQYSALRFDPKQVKDNLIKLFGGAKERMSMGQLELVDFIDEQLSVYKSAGTKVVKTPTGKGTVTPKGVTLENMLNLRVVLGNQTGKKGATVAAKGGKVSLDNLDYRDLSAVKAYLSDLVHTKVPELIPLDRVYGNISATKTAYEAGRDAFTKSMSDSFDVAKFLSSQTKSAAEKRAFIEGAKYRVFKLLGKAKKSKKAKNADYIDKVITENRELFSRMEAMFGQQGLQAMIDDVRPSIIKLKTAEDLRNAIPKLERPEGRNTAIGETIDVATAIGGVPGLVSKAGALGALRRLMGQATDPAEMTAKRKMYGGILSKMGNEASETYRSLEALMNRPIRPGDVGSIGRAGGMGVAVEAFQDSADRSDGELPQ